MRTYVISDIHGNANTFQRMLDTIGLNKTDKLILLGDYINRGPNSKGVLDTIMDLQEKKYACVALRGNHEDMIFDNIQLEDWPNASPETCASFGIDHIRSIDWKYINWMNKLPSIHFDSGVFFVHAGMNFEIETPLADERSMRWIQNWYGSINRNILSDGVIVHGHMPIIASAIEKMVAEVDAFSVINIDNGCYLKGEEGLGQLCCLEMEKRILTFVPNCDQ